MTISLSDGVPEASATETTVPLAGEQVSTAAPSVAAAGERSWLSKYQAALVVSDLCAGVIASTAAYLVRFVLSSPTVYENRPYLAGVGVLPPVWVAFVGWNRAYEGRFIGVGPDEFQRVVRSFLLLLATVSFISYATRAEFARGFVVVALPLVAGCSLLGRGVLRKLLHVRRQRGEALTSVLLVGGAESVIDLATTLRTDANAGMRVLGACLPVGLADDPAIRTQLADSGIAVLGDVDSVFRVVAEFKVATVAVTSSSEIGVHNLRWISWQLEETGTDLIVAPGLVDVAGSRLHVRPVAGLPLLHVEKPEFTGVRRLAKGCIDRAVASFCLLLTLPLLLVIAVAVRVSSRGPVLFRQTRVGLDGSTFTMLKFRSMIVDAEAMRSSLQDRNDHGNSVLFKMRNDPRVTRVGRLIRRFSLDELPQLVNVLNGSMSLVGPRPPLPAEVEKYAGPAHRRLLVKPGLTGLWQVSGRSALTWDESVRLDLRYVENWSPALDAAILCRTALTIMRGHGAY